MYVIQKSKIKGRRPVTIATAVEYGRVGAILTVYDEHDIGSVFATLNMGIEEARRLSEQLALCADKAASTDNWYCDDCGELIDSASRGCENPHCGETPNEKRLRLLAEQSEQPDDV